MSDEILWHVDENDQPIGPGFVDRKTAHSNRDMRHREIVVVLNQDGKHLIQKRSKRKDKYPEFWTAAATGHVSYGQSYETAAREELEQELGVLGVALSWLGKVLIETDEESKFVGIFSGTLADDQSITPDPEEVDEVRAVSTRELLLLLQTEKFTPGAYAVLAHLAATSDESLVSSGESHQQIK